MSTRRIPAVCVAVHWCGQPCLHLSSTDTNVLCHLLADVTCASAPAAAMTFGPGGLPVAAVCCTASFFQHVLSTDTMMSCRLLADVTCASAPAAALTFGPGDWGSWPAGCAGKTYRQLCVASCTYGGLATVNCMADAQWNTTAAGGCGECECTGAGTGAVLLLLHGV